MRFWIFVLLYFTFLMFVLLFLNRIVQHPKKTHQTDKIIQTLYRQSSRYAVASHQDKSPLIALLHANYAAGYLWAMKDIVSSQDFEKATGKNLLDFERNITAIQDKATQKIITQCPVVLEHIPRHLQSFIQ